MYPDCDEILKMAPDYDIIPVCREIYADVITPITLLRKLAAVSKRYYLLESVEGGEKWGRYSFLGFDPVMRVKCSCGKVTIEKDGEETEKVTDKPLEVLREILKDYKAPRLAGLPPFAGGFVGYFAYAMIGYAEPKLKIKKGTFNDYDMMLFDKVIAFDNLRQKIIVIANVKIDGSENEIEINYNKALHDIDDIINIIKNGEAAAPQPGVLKSDFRRLFDKEQFCEMIEKARKYIYEGDIFQVVLSNRLDADFEGSLLNTYRVLRTLNPSPYMFYFSGQDVEIAGASPETLVKLEDGELHTFPLAGTRPRGKTPEEDAELERSLLADPKELSEHNMLVDLGRNDIGRLSKFGTVEVEKYMSIERYSHVMHIGSTVRGQIRDDMDAVDAVSCVLPAGTLSGAPKIRACEIINELENNKRGIYGGAIGYIDFTGNLDTCIAIRIAFKKNGKVFVRSGAGIVADSVPESEYQECINKAQAVVNALKAGQEVDD